MMFRVFPVKRSSLTPAALLPLALIFLAPAAARAQGIDEDLRRRLTAATVYIETEVGLSSRDWSGLPEEIQQKFGKRPSGMGSGSGFLISPDGYLLTNAHVVSGTLMLLTKEGEGPAPPGTRPTPFNPEKPEDPFTLQFNVGWIRVVTDSGGENEKSRPATIVRVDPALDLALLKLTAPGEVLPHLEIGWNEPVRAGEVVIMTGFPGGVATELAPFVDEGSAQSLIGTYAPRASVNMGLVTAIRDFEGARRYQLDIRANPGNSGGPITNGAGAVVGILYAQISSLQSINYAIPIPYALKLLPRRLRAELADPSLSLSVADEGHGPAEAKAAGEKQGPKDESDPDGDGVQTFDEFLESGEFKF